MNELQYKMKVKGRYQPSKTVEALFTTAVVKIKADADKAITKQMAMSETESTEQTDSNNRKPEAFEDAAEEKVEIMAQSREPAAGEVSKTIQQMTRSQPKQPKKLSPAGLGLCAKDLMHEDLVWGSPEDSVQESLAKMQQHNTGYLLIGRNGVLEGLVSKSDLAGAISPYLRPEFAKWRQPLDDATLQIRVKWIMSRHVHTIAHQMPLAEIMENMSRLHLYALPVTDQQGKVLGMITGIDILKAMLIGR